MKTLSALCWTAFWLWAKCYVGVMKPRANRFTGTARAGRGALLGTAVVLLTVLGQNFPRHAGVSPFPRLQTSPNSNPPAPLITPVLKFSTFKPPGYSTTTLFLFKFDLTTRTSFAHLPSSLPAPPPTFLPTYSPFISLAKVALLTPTLPTLPPT